MKTICKFTVVLSSLVLALGCLTPSSRAATPVTSTGPISSPNPVTGGVTLALTTSGYEFSPLVGILVPPTGGTTSPLPPQVVMAHVVLHNETTTDIPWTLYSGITFEFTLYDANDKVVWDSLPLALPQFVMLATLKAGDSLNGMVAVPLFIKGAAPKPGVYTLEAKLYGSARFSATTSFVVNHIIAIN